MKNKIPKFLYDLYTKSFQPYDFYVILNKEWFS